MKRKVVGSFTITIKYWFFLLEFKTFYRGKIPASKLPGYLTVLGTCCFDIAPTTVLPRGWNTPPRGRICNVERVRVWDSWKDVPKLGGPWCGKMKPQIVIISMDGIISAIFLLTSVIYMWFPHTHSRSHSKWLSHIWIKDLKTAWIISEPCL